ncbi:MAG: tetratricopeptide repeat protein [Gammaproteobacteria bacterium]|nr:tetratricopeptide repeat protein [Gammaproteobacteria bacterium]
MRVADSGTATDSGKIPAALANARRALASDAEEARDLFSAYLEDHPQDAQVQAEFAQWLAGTGEYQAALDRFRRALSRQADNAGWYLAMGQVLERLENRQQALLSYEAAARLEPEDGKHGAALVAMLRRLGRNEDAIQWAAALVKRCQTRSEVLWLQYARALRAAGRGSDAGHALLETLKLAPDWPVALSEYGDTLAAQGQWRDALRMFQRAVELNAGDAGHHCNLGLALMNTGSRMAAEKALQTAIALDPKLAAAHYNYGVLCQDADLPSVAASHYRNALQADPALRQAANNLGNCLTDLGALAEGRRTFKHALRTHPNYVGAFSNLLCNLNYDAALSPAQRFAYCERWPLAPGPERVSRRKRRKRVRIGYVSGDFRTHSVSYFIEPVLRHHDRERVEVFCYSCSPTGDARTQVLRDLSDHWREAAVLSDSELEKQIREDEIDILVDLAGHTARNRAEVFARAPAPLQASWLGYPASSCLPEMDIYIADQRSCPADADGVFSEALVRLPRTFLCYAGPSVEVPVHAVPARERNGFTTYGCFNSLSKISDPVLDAWSTLLQADAGAILYLKNRPLKDPGVRALVEQRFASRGIGAQRLRLEGWQADATAHLACYDEVDVALDPFPYNGTTTTLEALWQGVPVVALSGDSHAGRVGLSVLTGLGRGEWAAKDIDGYVQRARALAADLHTLRDLRGSLRAQLAASELMDGVQFSRCLEDALLEALGERP